MKKKTYFVSKSSKIAFKALVLTLKCLDTAQIFAQVVVVEGFVLLVNPVLGLVDITVETLHFVRWSQLLGALGRQLLDRHPLAVQVLHLCLNFQRGFRLAETHQLHCDLIHFGQAHFVGFQVRVEVVEFLLHYFHLFQVFANVLDLRVLFLLLRAINDN